MNSPARQNVHGYAPAIWQRFTQPRHAGSFAVGASGVIAARSGTPAAKAVLELQLRVQVGQVAEARFKAYGCPTTIAVGEWLAEQAEGRALAELAPIKAGNIRAALEIPDDRAHCGFLGEDLILALLRQVSR